MFNIDGIDWDFPCDIQRNADMTASEISGMLLDKTYFNDVLGTFMSYTVALVIPIGKEADYTELYEALTDPIGDHTFVFPYNQDTITFVGRIENVQDAYYRKLSDKTIWRKTSFTAVANHPSKTYDLGEVVARGIVNYPDAMTVDDGSVWQYTTANGWQEFSAGDADNRYY